MSQERAKTDSLNWYGAFETVISHCLHSFENDEVRLVSRGFFSLTQCIALGSLSIFCLTIVFEGFF